MNHYIVHYPRNFANEYDVYAGSKARLARLAEILESWPRAENAGVHHISRKRAVYLGVTRPRQAKHDGEQWYGGWAEPRSGSSAYPETLAQQIAGAVRATEDTIDEHDAMQAQIAEYRRREFA
jgi:hypothetical protein